MKKIICYCLLFVFISCQKPNMQRLNIAVLQQYDWENIEKRDVQNPFDSSRVIASDTSLYSFNEKTFYNKFQSTNVSYSLGSGEVKSYVNQKTGEWKGDFELNPEDSTIVFSGIRHWTFIDHLSYPGMGADSTNLYRTEAKILLLNENMLKLEFVKMYAYDPDYPSFGGRVFIYYPVKKK